jgi:hypothetical protein
MVDIMRNKTMWIVLGVSLLLMLGSFWLGASSTHLNVILNGQPVEGLAAVGMASGGWLIGVLAGVFALGLVALVMLGVSVLLGGVFALVLLILLFAFAPFLLPGVLLALALAWFLRCNVPKKSHEKE